MIKLKPRFKICPHITDFGNHTFAIHRRRFFFWYSLYYTRGYISDFTILVGSDKDLKEICDEGNRGLRIDYWSRVNRIMKRNNYERTT